MSIWDSVVTAKVVTRGEFAKLGHYLVKVEANKFVKGNDGDFAITEMSVLFVYNDKDGSGHRVGDQFSDVCNLTGGKKTKTDTMKSRVKTFVVKAMGCTEEEVTAAELEGIFGVGQPLAGVVLEVSNTPYTTKETKTIITSINYKRSVPFAEMVRVIPAETLKRFYTGPKGEDLLPVMEKKLAALGIGVGA